MLRASRNNAKGESVEFVPPCFRNSLAIQGFTSKSIIGCSLGQSGHCRLHPVVTGNGGPDPGQNRDKFLQPLSPPNPFSFGGIVPAILGLSGGQSRRRRGPRSRQEVEAERNKLFNECCREIDTILADHHSQMPRAQAKAIGAIYARFSTRFQHSIGDQVRTLCEAAAKQGIHIPREFVFFDMAMAGYKDRRPGLNKLKDLLDTKSVHVLLVFSTNRLYRKTYKALQFVAEEVVERGIRCLLIKSGVDSADAKRWQMLLHVHAMVDEYVVGMYADNVRAAHEGLFDRQMICGTLTFGYVGAPIPGELTNRKKPRCRLIVDPITSKIVIDVFDWYVRDRLTIEEILRRLNADSNIPLGPKCLSGQWTRLGVRRILSNPRYRGFWSYGTTKNVWQSKGDYNRQVARDAPLRTAQNEDVGSSRVDLQACKLEYSIVSPK